MAEEHRLSLLFAAIAVEMAPTCTKLKEFRALQFQNQSPQAGQNERMSTMAKQINDMIWKVCKARGNKRYVLESE